MQGISELNNVRIKTCELVISALALVTLSVTSAGAHTSSAEERQIKAAFLYNFMKFVEWPPERMADANEPVVIGIIGSEDFVKALEPVRHKKVHNRNITLKYFVGYERLEKPQETDREQWTQKMEPLKDCHLLAFYDCDSMRAEDLGEIIAALRNSPALTVGEREDFLESGGIINFVMEDKKVHFEINATAARKARLKISSQLLRLAVRVVDDLPSQKPEG